MRIESVRFDASGSSTIVVSGGFVFYIPVHRISELGSALDALNPAQGDSLDPGRILQLLAADVIEFEEESILFGLLKLIDEEESALSKASGLCARAEQFRCGLELKLIARGIGKAASAYALDCLEAEGILDDARYASAWARSRLRRKPMGPLVLAAELRAKGLGSDAVKKALTEIDFEEVLPKAATAEMDRGTCDRDKLRNILRRQGFGYEALSAYFDEDSNTLA